MPILLKMQMRAPQELDERLARKAGRHERQHEVERRRERLRGQRQRIACFVGHAGRGKDLAGQIQVRERPLKHDRRALSGRAALDLADNRQQFFLTVAPDVMQTP